ncbi:thaumatin family protein [Lophium mytilinum]|uniref:Thaumatin family protein n=1 Tax=Lophium mytilinum TaxID=390894 RepID=A0A6A6QJ09_9PEZI|nr:thaumatin family protein [Lophium mytilinum]
MDRLSAREFSTRGFKRQDSDSPIIVTNYCGEDIWPGIVTQSGTGPAEGGFRLQPGESKNQTVSAGWGGRVWGRTNCTFNDAGTASSNGTGKACYTGDCNSALNCIVTGETPATLAEFYLDDSNGKTWYDISLVDGYNVPMAIVMQPLANSSLEDIPPNLTNPSCVATLGELKEPGYDPYTSGYEIFLGTNSSYPLPFDRNVDDSHVARWCPWDLQLSPPQKPGDGVYPYPDDNIQRPAFDPCYSACAKYNTPDYCCTTPEYGRGNCKAGDWGKAAKTVCPDAYSYALDDDSSMFMAPSGGGFQVVFCPGGRSTTILSSEREATQQMKNGSTPSGNANPGESPQKRHLTKKTGRRHV